MKFKRFFSNPYYFLTASALIALMIIVLTKKKAKRIFLRQLQLWPKRSGAITDITIHHGATAKDYDWKKKYTDTHIDKWGYGIAYHYVIDKDGNLFQTQSDNAKTYHNGYNNDKAISICIVGNYENYPLSEDQKNTLLYAIKDLKKRHKTIKYLNGHKEYKNSTKCPGELIDMEYFRKKSGLSFRNTSKARRVLDDGYLADN